MKIRHILFLLLALSAIAFMQPLVFFLGGLTLLLGVGVLVYRDLSPAVQDAVERSGARLAAPDPRRTGGEK